MFRLERHAAGSSRCLCWCISHRWVHHYTPAYSMCHPPPNDRKWMMPFVFVCGRAGVQYSSRRCVFVCVCLCVCVCVSRLQPHVWWIPLVAARQWHDLLPRSGADWLQYRPYINLVREKKTLERRRTQTFHCDGTSYKIYKFITGR